jgi:hypothetical protein
MFGWLRRWPTSAPKSIKLEEPEPTQLASVELNDVFRSRGLPTHTLIDRSNTAAYREIKFKLGAGGLVSVYGDSKSGKTVLSLKVLEYMDPIAVHGPHIESEDAFWTVLARKLGLGDEYTVVRQRGGILESKSAIKGSINAGAFKLEADIAQKSEAKDGTELKDVFSRDSHEVIDRLIQANRPIVIDDFHRIPKSVQRQIIHKLKPAVDRGISVVVVSIPEETEEIVQSLNSRGEIAARHAKIEAPLWQPSEIRQIAERGLGVLNVSLDAETVDFLTKNSYRNPLLMQAYCRQLCFNLGIDKTSTSSRKFVVPRDEARAAIRQVAEEYRQGYSDYLRVDDDGSGNWKLKSNKKVNIYTLVVLALARIPINYRVKVRTIKERIQDLLIDDMLGPNDAAVHNALVKITDQMKGKEDAQAPLRYDPINRYAFVTHPFFKVFCQWDVVPKYLDGT